MARFSVKCRDSAVEWDHDKTISLVWTDPPFGTGKVQAQAGRSYRDVGVEEAVDLSLNAIERLRDDLALDAVVCVVADYRIIHDLVVGLRDECNLFFQGEIIWTFGLGRPRTDWWPNRHNTIATFTKTRKLPEFDKNAVPREIRKAPKSGYPSDKPAGSVWDKTMNNTDPERVGYPNQKPIDIIVPFVLAHTKPGQYVADPFSGSGSTGAAALMHGRKFLGQDSNKEAVQVSRERFRRIM